MVTRRTATTRLVEGGTYSIEQPRVRVKLSKHLTVVGPLMELTHTVSGGTLTANPPAVRVNPSKPVVGSIVRLANSRTSTVSLETLHLSLQNPDHEFRQRYGTIARITLAQDRFYVVVAIAPDGKMMRVVNLYVGNNRHVRMKEKDGVWALTRDARTSMDWVTSTRVETPEAVLTSDEIVTSTAGYQGSCVVGYTGKPWEYLLARASSVVEIISPDDFDHQYWLAAQKFSRTAAVQGMYDRLTALATAHIPARTNSLSFDQVRRNAQKISKARRRHGAERIRADLANAAERWTHDRSNATAYLNSVESTLASFAFGDLEFDGVIRKWSKKHGFGELAKAKSCGHYHEGPAVKLCRTQYGDEGSYCPTCAVNSIVVCDGLREDAEVLCHTSCRSFMWSDGVRRFHPEPGVIGNRHSGKGVVGYVEPLVKQSRAAILTLGLELEMQAYNGNSPSDMARALRTHFDAANLLDKKASRKYIHFEEDGSTGPGGFEMVTGYTDIRTHDKLLKALLCKDNGKPAWSGKLRSHDASGKCCGIHVHIQAPKTLIHASKIRYFINAAGSEQLVRDVARRYNESYAKIERSSGTTLATKQAATMLKESKSWGSKADKSTAKMAMQRINRDRYQAINFQNVATVEFRIFRGSMLHETVMACMEFTQSVYEFCQYTPATRLTVEEFIEFINKAEHRANTRSLRTYLGRKGYSVALPNLKKVGPTTTPTPADAAAALVMRVVEENYEATA